MSILAVISFFSISMVLRIWMFFGARNSLICSRKFVEDFFGFVEGFEVRLGDGFGFCEAGVWKIGLSVFEGWVVEVCGFVVECLDFGRAF